MAESLYDRLGGAAAVDAAVDKFYEKVLADERINSFFANTDMTAQRGKQKAFLTVAFGGPANYSGKDMRKGHAHLLKDGLNDSHFDAVAENLQTTLEELGVAGDLVSETMALVETTRSDVLNR